MGNTVENLKAKLEHIRNEVISLKNTIEGGSMLEMDVAGYLYDILAITSQAIERTEH